MEYIDMQDKVSEALPTVCGHLVSDEEMQAFLLFLQGYSLKEIGLRLKRGSNTVSQWKRSEWWNQMYADHLHERQKKFESQLSAHNDRILSGYMDVMESRDDRTAMARIQGTKLYMEMGDDPLIKKQPKTVVNNTLIQTGRLDPEKINEMDEDELLEAARTGIIPDKVKLIE